MPTPTTKTQIIAAFEQMDLAALRVLLSDDYTYHACSKDYFLNYLEEAFEMLREGGDTHLEAVPGKCCSGSCACRDGKGYMFVSNHTCRYVSFIFEEQDNIPDFTDIHCCDEFGDMPPDVLLGEELNLVFSVSCDLKPRPTKRLKSIKGRCLEAVADFEQHCAKHPMMNTPLLWQWLERHEELHNLFELPPSSWDEQTEFYHLCKWVEDICVMLGREPWATGFMERFDERLWEDDQARYDFLNYQYPDILPVYFSLGDDLLKDAYVDYGDMKIHRDEFPNYLKVYELAHDYWEELLPKYNPVHKSVILACITKRGDEWLSGCCLRQTRARRGGYVTKKI